MNCCTPQARRVAATDRFFSRFARTYSRTARRSGLDAIQKKLLEGVRPHLVGASVLEIGCGVGTLHRALLAEGADAAIGVDISDGMLNEARRFATDAGLSERTEYLRGDFTEIAGEIQPRDLTLLDKVVCCYPDVERLVETSTAATQSTYALSFPRNRWSMRTAFKLHRLIGRVLRWEFYPCWHIWSDVTAHIERLGFAPVFRARTFLWEGVVFRRVSTAAG